MTILKTTNLLLRPWKESDAKCLYHFARNPNIGPVAGWPPHKSVDDSLNIIKTVFSKRETYAIVKDNIPIGCVGLLFHPDTNHSWVDGAAELGYWIAEEYWGNGFAFEASEEVVKRAFNDLDVERIFASYRYGNNQSMRVLEKLGFKYYSQLYNKNYSGEVYREIAMILEKK